MIKNTLLLTTAAVLGLSVAACGERDEPVDQDVDIENSMEEAGDDMEDMADDTGEAMEDMGDDMEDAADDVENEVDPD